MLPRLVRQARAERAVRPGLHGAPGFAGAGGRDRPRRLLLRPPGMVLVARRSAPARAHQTVRAPRRAGADRLAVLDATRSCDTWAWRRRRSRWSTPARRRSRSAPRPRRPPSSTRAVVRGPDPLRGVGPRAPSRARAGRRFRPAGPAAPRRAAGDRGRRARRAARWTWARCVRAAAMDQRITVRGYVTDAELAELYGRASAFAFLSSYEGFGLTPLDAIAAGDPGGGARYASRAGDLRRRPRSACRSRSRRSSRPRSNRCSSMPVERARLAQAGRDISARYSWTASGADTLAALVSARTLADGAPLRRHRVLQLRRDAAGVSAGAARPRADAAARRRGGGQRLPGRHRRHAGARLAVGDPAAAGREPRVCRRQQPRHSRHAAATGCCC